MKLVGVYIALLLAIFLLAQPTARGQVDTVSSVDTVYVVDTLSDMDKVRLAEQRIDADRSYHTQMITWVGIVVLALMVLVALVDWQLIQYLTRGLPKRVRDLNRKVAQYDKKVNDQRETIDLTFTVMDHHVQAMSLVVALKATEDESERKRLAPDVVFHWTISLWVANSIPLADPEKIPIRNVIRLALDGIYNMAQIIPSNTVKSKYRETLSDSLSILGETNLKEEDEYKVWFRKINQWLEHPDELLIGKQWPFEKKTE